MKHIASQVISSSIQSTSNALVKHWAKLRENPRYRSAQSRTIVSGTKMVSQIGSRITPHSLLLGTDAPPPSIPLEGATVYRVSDAVLKKVTGLVQPEPYAMEVSIPHYPLSDLCKKRWILVLDNISDPGNLGTLIRSSYVLGWEGCVFLGGTQNSHPGWGGVDPYNEKAIRAARGATFWVPFWKMKNYEELKDSLRSSLETKTTKITPLFASLGSQEGERNFRELTEGRFPRRDDGPPLPVADRMVLLVLGNESRGISLNLDSQPLDGFPITIPSTHSHSRGSPLDNLNVASAGAILLHLLRTRHPTTVK